MECNTSMNTAIVAAATDHDNHQHEDESCSPFCSCACCGQVCYINFQLTNMAVVTSLANTAQYFMYTNSFLPSNLFGNIWQPPKCS